MLLWYVLGASPAYAASLCGVENLEKSAISAIEQGPSYDIILTDFELPDGRGSSFVQEVRKRGLTAVPVVMITANDCDNVKSELEENLFQGYIQKPYAPSILIKTMIDVLGSDSAENKQSTSIINSYRIKEFTGGDQQLLNVLAQSFCNDYPNMIKQITFFVEELDVEGFKRKSHVMKSTMGYFALDDQIQLLDEILAQIKNKNKDKSNKALIEFKREMTEIINEIEQAFL